MLNDGKNPNSRSTINQIEITDLMLDNNSEFYLNMKPKTIKAEIMKKIKFYQDYGQINEKESNEFFHSNKILRSNSVELYKKHNQKKKKVINENNTKIDNNGNDIVQIIDKNNAQNIGKSNKKVTFLKSQFVTIIDVESYKQYNQENTCKDPYEGINNNLDSDKNVNGNERVVCSCFIM
jgi:hypothetical protein